MGYYNPYRHSGTSGSGNYASGAGSAYSHGQQGSNPWFNRQQSGYGQPYNTAPNQGEYNPYQQPQQQGYPGQYQSQQGYPGMYPRPPAGKGRGMGGIGMGPGSSIGALQAGQLYQQDYGMRSHEGKRNYIMGQYQQLLEQRHLEEALGLGMSAPGWSQHSHLAEHGYPTRPGQSMGYGS